MKRTRSDATKLRQARAELRILRHANWDLRNELDECRNVGGQMSNICFNLSQQSGRTLDERACQSMAECQKKWDEITRVWPGAYAMRLFRKAMK